MKKILFSIAFCTFALCSEKKIVLAVEDLPEPASAITAVIADGIIKNSNGRNKAIFDLDWNLLPVTEKLVQELIGYSEIKQGSPKTITFNQTPGNSQNILCDVNAQDLIYIYQALGVDENSSKCNELKPKIVQVNPNDPSTKKTQRDSEIDEVFKRGGVIKSAGYISMVNERSILSTILQSRGIEYALNLRAGLEPEVPDFADNNINWEIKIYKYSWSKNFSYYRFSIKAKVARIEKNNFLVDKPGIKFDARIKFKNSATLTSITNPYFSAEHLNGNVKFVEDPNFKAAAAVTANQIEDSLSALTGIFNIIGGGSQLGTISQGLLGGTDNSSIISGGLFNFGSGRIDPLIGVNREIGKIGDISAGVVYGVGLGQKTSLFLGPSLQESIFTVSAGLTLGASQQSDLGFAGLISVDLSRVSGSKKDVNTIELSSSRVGGSAGKPNESNLRTVIEDASKNTLLAYKINSCSSDKSFQLQKIGDSKPSVTITTGKTNETKLVYLPEGDYQYVIDNGVSVSIAPQNTTLKTLTTFTLNPQVPQIFNWTIKCN
jgi:hypothetical protein